MAQYNMPKPNEALKDFFKDNDVYASVFNDFLFKEKIVDPNYLEPEDSAYAETIIKNNNTVKINKYRDIVRRTKQGHLIIGIEDQDKIHYAMPVRKMLYDSLSYTAELSEIAANAEDKTKWSVDEKLSKVPKGTKLAPTITVVFYTGENKWDGPNSLHDMLNVDGSINRYVPDYPLHVIDLGHDPNLSFSNGNLEQLRVALSSIYNETADTSEYKVKPSIAALSGILANDYNLYKTANESKGGERPMCEVLRKRDERLLAENNAKRDAERDALLAERDAERDALLAENNAKRDAERDALLAEKDAAVAEKDAALAEIAFLKEQLRLAQA